MRKIILTIILLTTISCSSNDSNNSSDPITVTLIGKGELYGNGAENIPPQHLVITDQNSWSVLLAAMNTTNNVTIGFAETEIDFDNFTVIAVIDAIQLYGGYSISITNVIENESTIAVTVETLANGGVNPVVNQPFHIIKIPKKNKPVVFE